MGKVDSQLRKWGKLTFFVQQCSLILKYLMFQVQDAAIRKTEMPDLVKLTLQWEKAIKIYSLDEDKCSEEKKAGKAKRVVDGAALGRCCGPL